MSKTSFVFSATILACANLFAQEQEGDSTPVQILDEVVVSDTRFPIKRENSGKTVIKIGAEELERNQGKTVAQLINTKSGIEIAGSRGRDGDVLGVFARGGRGKQVLVIIDGVRVADPSSFSTEYDLRLLSTSQIASIEIIKGAASTLYGTNAATAVINITTKKSSERKVAGYFQSAIGTNQTADDQNYNAASLTNQASVSGTLERFSYDVNIAQRYSNGLSAAVTPENEEDDFSQFSGNLKIGYHFSDKFELSVYGNHTKYDNEFDAALAEAPNRSKTEQNRLGLASSLKYNKGSIHLNTAYSRYLINSQSTFGVSDNDGRNLVLDLYNKYIFAEKFHTILGVNYIKDKAVFDTEVDFNIVDPYLNLVYLSGSGLNINAGARLNTHSEYGNHFVYNLNPSYTFPTARGYFKVLSSYATSYITPNLIQLFGAFGNEELEPEENATLEGGVEIAINSKLRISALYFDRNEKNTIGFDQNFISINVSDEINVNGFETEISWKPITSFSVNANYTFTERKGDNAIRIPKHKLNIFAMYQFSEKTDVSLSYSYTGERLDTDFSNFPFTDVSLDAFSLLGVYLQHQITPDRLSVFLNIDNLLNEDYVEVIGFTTRGRNLSLGARLTL